ncbi:hypothetical protein WBJ53_27290 [Spirosoma sp. SC4-14]|uniref:hypothetical protein n=1 Tax=Spirosoma sp. SC4-14 TaxID=3128900 RepID=UPI0030CCB8B3
MAFLYKRDKIVSQRRLPTRYKIRIFILDTIISIQETPVERHYLNFVSYETIK